MKPVQSEASITTDPGAYYKGRGSRLLQLGYNKQGEGLFYPKTNRAAATRFESRAREINSGLPPPRGTPLPGSHTCPWERASLGADSRYLAVVLPAGMVSQQREEKKGASSGFH